MDKKLNFNFFFKKIKISCLIDSLILFLKKTVEYDSGLLIQNRKFIDLLDTKLKVLKLKLEKFKKLNFKIEMLKIKKII